MGRFRRDLAWGIGWGIRIAGGFAALSLGIVGVQSLSPGATPELTASVSQILVFHLLGGLSGGAVVGMLRPLGGHRSGAVVLGVVAALPITLGGYLILLGPNQMSAFVVLLSVGQAVLGGGIAGALIWRDRELFRDQ